MCQSCRKGQGQEGCGCCITSAPGLEDEIRMLEALRTIQRLRLDSIDRKIESLKQPEKQ